MRYIGIIPARYASSRFPGKPLVVLGGKPLVVRVWERVRGWLDRVVVATDDERIKTCVESFGGSALLTSSELRSGTERVAEAYRLLGEEYDVVINIQGDEPFINKEQIESIKKLFEDKATGIGTIVKPFCEKDGWRALENPNSPKVVVNKRGEAMYFSRSVVPFVRGKAAGEWLSAHCFYKHIGLYAYKPAVLQEIVKLPPTSLERAECLEQLRWLENGYIIKVAASNAESIGIDTPEDLTRAELFLRQNSEIKEE